MQHFRNFKKLYNEIFVKSCFLLKQILITSYTCFAACAPVLLPVRVVQALNINVHALGVQISPQQGLNHVLILI